MKILVAVTMILVFVTGCATPEQQAKTEGTAAGAGIGAAAGALLGYAITGKGSGAAIGAGIGAGVGGVAGFSYANMVVNRRRELKGKEDDLDARISYAKAINRDTQKYNQQLEKQVGETSRKVADIRARVKRNEMSAEALKNEKLALERNLKDARKNQALAQKELGDLKEFRSRHGHSKELDSEISRLETNLDQVKKNTSALAALSQRI